MFLIRRVLNVAVFGTMLFSQPIKDTDVDLTMKSSLADLAKIIHAGRDRITLKGYASIYAKSDHAYLSLKVKTKASGFKSAIEKLNKKVSELRYWITKSGLPNHHIVVNEFIRNSKAGSFFIVNSYVVENIMKIKVRSMDELTKVADNIKKDREVEILGLTFEFVDRDSLFNFTREKALEATLKKAEIYERKLGLKLVPVNFKELERIEDAYQSNVIHEILRENTTYLHKKAGERLSMNQHFSKIGFGEAKLEITVLVTFEIRKGD